MRFIYVKDELNIGFIAEAPTADECFELGLEKIEKADGELLNYYSIELNE
jgi:hypothetical protein